jgi:hypothetical protein
MVIPKHSSYCQSIDLTGAAIIDIIDCRLAAGVQTAAAQIHFAFIRNLDINMHL